MNVNGNRAAAVFHTNVSCIVDIGNPNDNDKYTTGEGITIGMLYLDGASSIIYKCGSKVDGRYRWYNILSPLVITVDEQGPRCSANQVYNHIKSGGSAVLYWYNTYWYPVSVSADTVIFNSIGDEGFCRYAELYEYSLTIKDFEYATQEYVNNNRGVYVIRAAQQYDEELGEEVYTPENFTWEELVAAVKANKQVICRAYWVSSLVDDGFLITIDYQLVEFSEEENFAVFSAVSDGVTRLLTLYNDDGERSVQHATQYLSDLVSSSVKSAVTPLTVTYNASSKTASHNRQQILNAVMSGKQVLFRPDAYVTIPLNCIGGHAAKFYNKNDDDVDYLWEITDTGKVTCTNM